MTEEPFALEGELVWEFDGDQSITPGYVRHTFADFDHAKYDAFISHMDSAKERFQRISGLRSLRIARILANRMAAMASPI